MTSRTTVRGIALVCCLMASQNLAWAEDNSAKPTLQWENKALKHQSEAKDVFLRNGFLYLGGDAPRGKISKVDVSNGRVVWSVETRQSYQPSYPVSNSRVVVYGRYYEDFSIVGRDDKSGKLLWTIPTEDQIMSAACFSDDLVFVGSYDRHFYAIDWRTGTLRWKVRLPNRIWSTACLYEQQVVVGCYDGFLYGIDQATGKISWKIDCGGRIGSSPVCAGRLVFLGVDDQHYGDNYDSSKVQKTLLVIDLETRKILMKYQTPTSWSQKILVSKEDVYFFDSDTLYAFDSKAMALSWKRKISIEGLRPDPLIFESAILCMLNTVGRHGNHATRSITLSRRTGKRLSSNDEGGIGLPGPHYKQFDNLVIAITGGLKCFQARQSP